MRDNRFQIVPVDLTRWTQLWRFFSEIKDNKFFHPHPFTSEEAYTRCRYKGQDLYYLLIDNEVLGYGLLRGWDDKWDDICLGIIIKPSETRRGLGDLLMHFLHTAARRKQLARIRLKVHPENIPAQMLYEKLGYVFNGEMYKGEAVGYKRL